MEHWEEMDLAGVMNGALGLVCAAAVLAMSTGTILQFSQNSKIKENYHNVGELKAFVQEIAEVVPENTHGFGLNVAEIYSLLHWNTQCFTMDFSDMAVIPESLQELQEQLTEADAPYVFTSRSSLLSGSGMIRRLTSGLVKRMSWIRPSRTMRKNFSFTGKNKKEMNTKKEQKTCLKKSQNSRRENRFWR